jgi:putative membrane protein
MKNLFTLSAILFYSVFIAQNINEKDLTFAKEAAQSSMLEIQLGQLAQSNAATPEIKKMGQHMVIDHSKANTELKALAEQKKFTLPTELEGKTKKTYEGIAKKQGEAFDKAYSKLMVKEHKSDVKKFEKAIKDCQDAELKDWAGKNLPVLQHHLQLAEATCNQLKKQ